MREIGSEFSYIEYNVFENYREFSKGQNLFKDYVMTFSGRTAIETVLTNEPGIKSVLIPSYCCDSMMEPFKRRKINISFYNVYYEDGFKINIDLNENIDAVLWCNYFGYAFDAPDFSGFISNGGIVIEDITHSFLSKDMFNNQSNYLIGSIRKWSPVLCGGICASIDKELCYKPNNVPQNTYLEKKKEAMILKQEYLNNSNNGLKEKFLEKYSKCNQWLSDNYSGLAIDSESLCILKNTNWGKDYLQRRLNAMILYKGIKSCHYVNSIFELEKMECPLFFPVIVKKSLRNSLRQELIDNRIYCPVHWPKPTECESNLYDIELSLICDQRYDEEDMTRIVDVIQAWDRKVENSKRGN